MMARDRRRRVRGARRPGADDDALQPLDHGGALFAGLWLVAVMPAIDGFPLLAASLGVVLLPVGLVRPSGRRSATPSPSSTASAV